MESRRSFACRHTQASASCMCDWSDTLLLVSQTSLTDNNDSAAFVDCRQHASSLNCHNITTWSVRAQTASRQPAISWKCLQNPGFRAAAAAPFCLCLRFASRTRRFVPTQEGWLKSERPRTCSALDAHQQVKSHFKPWSTRATQASHFDNANVSPRGV